MAKKFEMGDYLKTLAQPVSNSDTALFFVDILKHLNKILAV